MLNLEPIHNLHLEIFEPSELSTDLSVKNFLLFSEVDGEVCALICERYLVDASNYYTKLQNKYKLLMLDEDSFDRLYNRFLELRTDKTMESMQEDSSEDSEEDISLTDFLRTSSDILTSEESAPIIKFVNALFYQAVKKRASDIHIEVQEKRGEVRFRIDGMLVKTQI